MEQARCAKETPRADAPVRVFVSTNKRFGSNGAYLEVGRDCEKKPPSVKSFKNCLLVDEIRVEAGENLKGAYVAAYDKDMKELRVLDAAPGQIIPISIGEIRIEAKVEVIEQVAKPDNELRREKAERALRRLFKDPKFRRAARKAAEEQFKG